jgi:hypothetical protein
VVSVRLTTSLDSAVTAVGSDVEAQLTQPLFSSDAHLIFPAGSTVRGQVVDVKPAKSRHRNGQLAFSFTEIEAPASFWASAAGQQIAGNVVGAQVAHDLKGIRLDEKGAARIVESKKRFVAPAWALFKVDRAFGATADSLGTAVLGAYRSKALKEIAGGGSGFGLPGSVASAMVPPVAIGLGIYGAARSVYFNFLGRGRDIEFPANTRLEVRLCADDCSPDGK